MIRKSVVEGKFYTNDIKELNIFLSENIKNITPKSKIILAPHAGYFYSGKTAGKSFSSIERDFEIAFIIGTAHTIYANKCLLIKDAIFQGIFGDIKTDDEIIDFLLKDNKSFELNPKAHISEHSVEVMLPFLNHINKNFKIVPIVVNGEDKEILLNAAQKIASAMKIKKSVCVISSDLSHYPTYEISKTVDNAIALSYQISMINKDIDYFYLTKELIQKKYFNYLDTVACGFSPMIIGLKLAMHLDYNSFDIIECINSGDVIKSNSVVGYLAGIFLNTKEKEYKLNLCEDEKKYILFISRQAIENYLKNKKILNIEHFAYPKLNLPFSVFVTLTIKNNLRGCIGSISPHMLLGDAVCDYSVKAGFKDTRFSPLTAKELENLNIEISILSPLKKIKDISEIKKDLHGVYVKNGFKSGTYLPQVWEHFNTKEEFLISLLNEKSAVGYDKLNDPATGIYIYTVESIKDNF